MSNKKKADGLVHISKMSGKLEGLKAISTNTLTNPFCVKMNEAKKETICSHCYSHSMLKGFRKNTAPALQRNSDLLSSKVLDLAELPTIKDEVFRFSAHGELINITHLSNLFKICRKNSKTTFSLWTKRKDIVTKTLKLIPKPNNLILIYSNPKIGSILKNKPKGFDKTFNNVLEDEFKEEQNCTGQQCKDCLLCYQHNTTDTIVEMVKKY